MRHEFALWKNSPTHQWRRYTLEEPIETFLACDGHQRMKGGSVSGVWRWILEPVFHFVGIGFVVKKKSKIK
jgi:hypothetical protein